MRLAPLLRLAWIAVALLPLARGPGQESSAPPSLELPAAPQGTQPDLREELFALEQIEDQVELDLGAALPTADDAGPSAEPKIAGVARCRKLALPGGQQLELDVQFVAEGARVLHIERSGADGTTLVWREILPGAGRTVSARCVRDGTALALREWAGRLAVQSELASPSGLTLPLHLLELARTGADLPASVQHFDPLARQLEALALSATELESGARRIDLTRPDGTLAARWLLQGGELAGFQWQGGNLRARRIAAGEYERLLAPPAPPDSPER
jgi:hypothetical protein